MTKKQLARSATFIGLDLAWSERSPSGCAIIRGNRLIAWTGQLGDNNDILRFIKTYIPAEAKRDMPTDAPVIMGIDAPLRVPNISGSRRCDRELSTEWRAFQAGALPANRRLLTRGQSDSTVRGEALVALLQQRLRFTEAAPIPKRTRDRIVCEIYPHPAHVSLFNLEKTLKYKARSKRPYEERWDEMERYQRYLRELNRAHPPLKETKKLMKTNVRLLRGKALKEHEDILDAISCAYIVKFLWHRGPRSARVYGDVVTGHIIVPLTKTMKSRLMTAASGAK